MFIPVSAVYFAEIRSDEISVCIVVFFYSKLFFFSPFWFVLYRKI